MKIAFSGGGTGGHFYPIIAVAEELNRLVKERKLVEAKLFYLADKPYNETLLFENKITFIPIIAGKLRRYFSFYNFLDFFKTGLGIVITFWKLFLLYPDVIFSKGGYLSFPVMMAARFLGIPVIIHESDSHPGKVNLWSAKFARRVAVSYPEALAYFPKEKTALSGNPIRNSLLNPIKNGAHEFLDLDRSLPIIFVTGGSQGAMAINDTLIDILPALLERYQIIHQVGRDNLPDIEKRSRVVLASSAVRGRYKLFDYLDTTAIRMVAGVAELVISRAGSVIFEIAVWGIPSIIIPIPEPISHDQKTNAFTYARSGGAVVIEQENLSPSVLLGEINRLMADGDLRATMRRGAMSFGRREAGELIAKEIISLALPHES